MFRNCELYTVYDTHRNVYTSMVPVKNMNSTHCALTGGGDAGEEVDTDRLTG